MLSFCKSSQELFGIWECRVIADENGAVKVQKLLGECAALISVISQMNAYRIDVIDRKAEIVAWSW